jgi:flagellar basal-body rod protein FlgC
MSKCRLAAMALASISIGLMAGPLTADAATPITAAKPAVKTGLDSQIPQGVAATGRPSSRFSCADVRRSAMRLSAHATNLANRNTTRTPAGGPYKRLEVSCAIAGGAFCSMEQKSELRVAYDPKHPDADGTGYVRFPAVNVGTEFAGVNSAATELKLLSSQNVCGTASISQGNGVLIRYLPDFDVISDTIAFGADGKIVSWTRLNKDGKITNMAFNADGSISGF